MTYGFKAQTKQAAIAHAVAGAFAALGSSGAQGQTLNRADIALDRDGSLVCRFKDVGVGAYAQVTYGCGALAVGVLTQCFLKGKPVANSSAVLSIFTNVSNAGPGGEVEALVARSNGQISGTVSAETPVSGGTGALCLEPSVATVTAIRWCNASLVDTTYAVTGATLTELFMVVERLGSGAIPSCTELLSSP